MIRSYRSYKLKESMENEKDLDVNENNTTSEENQVSLEAKLAEAEDKYLRTLAEFENFKKRTIKERSDLIKYQGERVFGELLGVLDNFELAIQHLDADPATVKQGVQMIFSNFQDFLTKWEVRAESCVGQKFDPNKHNAISKVPGNEETAGNVVGELKKAYFYKDKLLRHADVVIADNQN